MAEIKRRTPTETLLRIIGNEVQSLEDMLPGAREFQWEAAPRRQARAPGAHITAGTIADPTADVALDERRLALREAITTAETRLAALWRLAVELRGASRGLAAAVLAYGYGREEGQDHGHATDDGGAA